MSKDSTASKGYSKYADQAREQAEHFAHSAAQAGQGAAEHYVREPANDLFGLAKDYARDNPDIAACWAFGLGFLIGWKLKP